MKLFASLNRAYILSLYYLNTLKQIYQILETLKTLSLNKYYISGMVGKSYSSFPILSQTILLSREWGLHSHCLTVVPGESFHLQRYDSTVNLHKISELTLRCFLSVIHRLEAYWPLFYSGYVRLVDTLLKNETTREAGGYPLTACSVRNGSIS